MTDEDVHDRLDRLESLVERQQAEIDRQKETIADQQDELAAQRDEQSPTVQTTANTPTSGHTDNDR